MKEIFSETLDHQSIGLVFKMREQNNLINGMINHHNVALKYMFLLLNIH